MLGPHIIKTLLYYDLFEHSLNAHELYFLLPQNSVSRAEIAAELHALVAVGTIREENGFFHVAEAGKHLGSLRIHRERLARRRRRIASFMALVMKRFPFVRAVFVSGDLSKGVASPESDIDYVVVAAPGRLWICRSLLIAFKKIFLLNRKKYFCLNYFLDSDHLLLTEQNYYTATEVAHLKPLYNTALFLQYMNANAWIRSYFPNFRVFALTIGRSNDRQSQVQRALEALFPPRWADELDTRLMHWMQRIWKRRYPQFDSATHDRIFRCSKHESRAFVGNFADRILSSFRKKLIEHGIEA